MKKTAFGTFVPVAVAISALGVALVAVVARPVGAAPPAKVDSVQLSPKQPLQVKLLPVFGQAGGTTVGKIFTVPAGKRFVIEDIAVFARTRTDSQRFMVFVTLHTANDVFPPEAAAFAGGLYPIPLADAGLVESDGTRSHVGSRSVHLYADSGTDVHATLERQTIVNDGADFAHVTLSGYLVDVP